MFISCQQFFGTCIHLLWVVALPRTQTLVHFIASDIYCRLFSCGSSKKINSFFSVGLGKQYAESVIDAYLALGMVTKISVLKSVISICVPRWTELFHCLTSIEGWVIDLMSLYIIVLCRVLLKRYVYVHAIPFKHYTSQNA